MKKLNVHLSVSITNIRRTLNIHLITNVDAMEPIKSLYLILFKFYFFLIGCIVDQSMIYINLDISFTIQEHILNIVIPNAYYLSFVSPVVDVLIF